jgi:hypothetical protein
VPADYTDVSYGTPQGSCKRKALLPGFCLIHHATCKERERRLSPLNLSLVQMDSVHLNPEINLDRIEDWVEREKGCRTGLVVFPSSSVDGCLDPIMPGEKYARRIIHTLAHPGLLGNVGQHGTCHFIGDSTVAGPDLYAYLCRSREAVAEQN